ncbi:11752_t:CDS:2, partial [Dentiscutata erythropus]
ICFTEKPGSEVSGATIVVLLFEYGDFELLLLFVEILGFVISVVAFVKISGFVVDDFPESQILRECVKKK